MAFLDKLNEIEAYLQKIEQLNASVKNRQELNRLQGDLIKEYLRDLYELYASLENETKGTTTVGKAEPLVERVVVKEPIAEEAIPEAAEVPEDVVKVEEPVASNEVVAESNGVQETTIQPQPVVVKSPETADDVNEPLSLSEKFQKESIATDLNRKKVTDKKLGQLIPLNEKFVFISEFFGNSISAYESAIVELDALTTKTEVLDYMQKNFWSKDVMESQQDLIDRFIRIIDLKYLD